MLYYEKAWFAERSRIYKELSERENLFKKLDSTFFYFNSPYAGWIDLDIYINGKKQLTCDCSNAYDPFPDIKQWLEDIVLCDNLETAIRIDNENAEKFLHYEKLSNRNNVNIGMFYVYDSYSNSIPFFALCDTKDFIKSVYLVLLALCGDCYNTHFSDFAKSWYYDENFFRTSRKYNNLTFYNKIKSPLIEWYICSSFCLGYENEFKKMPIIKETISIWCDYGDALFWGRGVDGVGCCLGDADSLSTYSAGEINLASIQGLREWYNEWSSAPIPDKWTKKQWDDWYKRGYEFAKQVRKLLPDTIDLYYYDWYPKKKVIRNDFSESYPMIVFNENAYVNKNAPV